MPGVDILKETINGPAAAARAPGSTYFVPIQAERGPVDKALTIRSMAELVYHYGPRVVFGAGHDNLESYFGDGGGRAVVGRVVGSVPVLATSELIDRAVAPLATLDVNAKDPGAWGNALTREVQNGTNADTFRLIISGTPDGEDEVFDNLESPADAAEKVSRLSRWVNVVNLGSASAAPTNNPAVVAEAALAGGDDDRDTIVAADYVDAANALFNKDFGAGAIAIPGQPSSAVGAGLLAHCAEFDRVAILTTAVGQTPTQAKAAAAALSGSAGSEYGAIYYPWVKVPDGAGGTRLIDPSGYVAGARARAHETTGPWRAGAGAISEARFVVGLERELTRAEGDDLDDNLVNAIRTIAKTTRVYGSRSLSEDLENWRFITYADVVNVIAHEADRRMEDYVHLPIDGLDQVFSDVYGELVGIAHPMALAGGLYPRRDPDSGEILDPGYRADTGPAVNTVDTKAQGIIKGTLAVRPAPTGALVVITIAKAAFNAPL